MLCFPHALLLGGVCHSSSLGCSSPSGHPPLIPHSLLSAHRCQALAPDCWLHVSHWSYGLLSLACDLCSCVFLLSLPRPLTLSLFTLPLMPPDCPSLFVPRSVFSSQEFFPAHRLSLGSSRCHLQVHGVGVTVSLGWVLGASGQGPVFRSSGPVSDLLPLPPLAAVFPPVPGARLHGGAGSLLRCRDSLCPRVFALAGRGVPRHQGECALASWPVAPALLTPGRQDLGPQPQTSPLPGGSTLWVFPSPSCCEMPALLPRLRVAVVNAHLCARSAGLVWADI